MKIFWSWQSDNSQKHGRHFVRKALEKAIEEIKTIESADEAERDFDPSSLEYDSDTSGVSGSPPIAQTILEKISRAAVFVADVTPVGMTGGGAKHLANPNVMIELGYALKALGHQRIVLVMNSAEGGVLENLPFDLRHWRSPIKYELPKNASADQLAKVERKLIGDLKRSIVPCVSAAVAAASELQREYNRDPAFTLQFVGPDSATPEPLSISQEFRPDSSLDDVRREHPKLDASPGRIVSRRALSGLAKSPLANFHLPISQGSNEDIQRYNQKLDRYYSEYERYLQSAQEYESLKRRSFRVRLKLTNEGRGAATNIDVELPFPDGMSIYEENNFPKPPTKPVPPEKTVSATLLGANIRVPILPAILAQPWTEERLSINSDAGHLDFRVADLKHHTSKTSDVFILTFDDPPNVGIKTFSASVSANELLDVEKIDLALDISKEI